MAGHHLRRGLLIALSIVLIIATTAIWRQISFMKDHDLHFQKENVLLVPVSLRDFPDAGSAPARLEAARHALLQLPQILSVSLAMSVPGAAVESNTFVLPEHWPENEPLRFRITAVDAGFFGTFGMEIVEGRDFSDAMPGDKDQAVIVNEKALQAIGWQQGVGRTLKVGDKMMTIVGVVRDYHTETLRSDIRPLMHRFGGPDNRSYRFLAVRLRPGHAAEAVAAVRDVWRRLDPDRPFDYSFVDETFDEQYKAEERIGAAVTFFSGVAIVIACVGLFGLVTLSISQRTKEIGIRKVLGATVPGVVLSLSRRFLLLVALANVIAWPLAYLAVQRWLQDFAYRSEVNLPVYLAAGLAALVIALGTVSLRAVRAALANPVEALRYE